MSAVQSNLRPFPRPEPLKRRALPSETIQKIGNIPAPLPIPFGFKPWNGFSNANPMCRIKRPVVAMTKKLDLLYRKVGALKSGKNLAPKGEAFLGDKRIYRWTLRGGIPLGKGANGAVYAGLDKLRGCPIAVKIFKEDSPWAQHEHVSLHIWTTIPHVVRFHGGYQEEGGRVLIMDKTPPSLDRVLKSQSSLPFEEVISIFQQLLEMHQVTSALGEVHGDLKPANLAYRGGKLTVIDLGAAHCPRREWFTTPFQTLMYRAPECILGKQYDTSVDLWSIGCIIFEVFVGYPFIIAGTEEAAMFQMIEKIGLPQRSFLETCSRCQQFSPFASFNSASLPRVIRAACIGRKLSTEQSEAILELLQSILKYEDRIDVAMALRICRGLWNTLHDPLEEKSENS